MKSTLFRVKIITLNVMLGMLSIDTPDSIMDAAHTERNASCSKRLWMESKSSYRIDSSTCSMGSNPKKRIQNEL